MDRAKFAVLKIATLYPELLGTYGDSGNAKVLRSRATSRGIQVEMFAVGLDDALPQADIFLLGGGEDGPQRLATERLIADGSLARRVDDGAHLVAVCAGLQIIGSSFVVAGGDTCAGLGLVDMVTTRAATRAVGNLVTKVGSSLMIGFENHGGCTTGSFTALGEVLRGVGSDGVSDGVLTTNITATYAHGPVLALNPWLADSVLSSALGTELESLSTLADDLYAHRLGILGY